MNYKNKFVKKIDLQFINFENAYIFHSTVDDDKDILVICECEKGKKYTGDKKLLELFSTCYSTQLMKNKLELIEQPHFKIINSINEGIVAIKNGTIILKNKLGEEILRNLPEITSDNFYGERIINTFIKDDFRSIHFIRKKIDDVDLLLFEDITEKTKMMNSVIKMKNFHILGELTAGVAHEINNPLQIVLGIAQLIDITGKNLDENTKKYIEMIKDSSLRIKKIVEFLSSYMEHNKISKEEN